MRALAEKNRKGWLDSDFNQLGEYRLRCEEIGRMITRYLKRVRKPLAGENPVGLRYLWVTEQHKSGLPHVHMLAHETVGLVSYDRLMGRWAHGHATAKLVKSEGAASKYVAKYMTKDSNVRVRASLHYGQPAKILNTALSHRSGTLPFSGTEGPAHSQTWSDIFDV